MRLHYNVIEGNLIQLALQGEFDVIVHGCNCMVTMGAGIALPMKEYFRADVADQEFEDFFKDVYEYDDFSYNRYLKLGNIDYFPFTLPDLDREIYVVNAYTQYMYGRNHPDGEKQPLDYDALVMCLKKVNRIFPGRRIGLPKIGCGLAGGKWHIVETIIRQQLVDCYTTVVIKPE